MPGVTDASASAVKPTLIILYGSRSGHGEEIAENARRLALGQGFDPVLRDMSQHAPEELIKAQNALVIVSTHGDGIAPMEAEDLYKYLHNGDSPDLQHMNFTVCALGDSSYQLYCQTGKDFDAKLEALGGQRVYPRVDCDVDFEDPAEDWIKGALASFAEIAPPSTVPAGSSAVTPTSDVTYGKKNPFEATLLKRILLNGQGSDKETYHLELSLEGSSLQYNPGDALGVYGVNHEILVNNILETLRLNPHVEVNTHNGPRQLVTALTHMYELSVISIEVLRNYAGLSPNESLDALLKNSEALQDYLYGRDILDMLTDFPVPDLTADILIGVLRKMPARLYSIASSAQLHPNEVHLTVSAVRYELNERKHQGVCSTFLADHVALGSKVPVYIDKNKGFKLPDDPETPIIMVGPGTGVAPFRAFVEERTVQGGDNNWLFFGDQHFTTDFLYQLEWQRYIKKNKLRLDVAFSRDQKDKLYVQHRMKEQSKDLYQWIQDGAHFYVCGDEKRMAKDVHQALLNVFISEGGMSADKAEACVKNMQKSKRYQTDVY
jgi:sulfite reductase (NADPH) flavoprotein alpha-component